MAKKTIDQSGAVPFVRPDKALFTNIPSESIDYAVIEKCTTGLDGCNNSNEVDTFAVKMVELDAGWNDLGAWNAVWQVGKQDGEGNVTTGDTMLANTKNSLVHANSRLVAVAGVENLIIIETPDAVLVTDRNKSQDVKSIVNQLEQQVREEKIYIAKSLVHGAGMTSSMKVSVLRSSVLRSTPEQACHCKCTTTGQSTGLW